MLPCGAGKTLVGAAAMATSSTTTLILVTNTVSARQWKDELLRRTSLTEDEIGEYSGAVKEVRPVTIATYQVLTLKRGGLYPHLELLDANDWGLIIYDEVHLLPAPIFRMTADLQARRRLGLTATLVREDGREGEVFSLIGPKRYDAPWKDIEAQGYIAPAECIEVRVDLPRDERVAYAMAEDGDKYRLCSTSETKSKVVAGPGGARHEGDQILVIGQYIDQLDELADRLDAPVIKGGTPVKERQRLFNDFREGKAEDTGGVQGCQLLHRPARGLGSHPGLRFLRLPPGGGPAAGPPAAPEVRRPGCRLLHRRRARHPRPGLHRKAPTRSWRSRATRSDPGRRRHSKPA